MAALRKHLNTAQILNHWAVKQSFKHGTEKTLIWTWPQLCKHCLKPNNSGFQNWQSNFSHMRKTWSSGNSEHSQSVLNALSWGRQRAHYVMSGQISSGSMEKGTCKNLTIGWRLPRPTPNYVKISYQACNGGMTMSLLANCHLMDPLQGQFRMLLGGVLHLKVVSHCTGGQEEQDQYWKAFEPRKCSKQSMTALITQLIMTAWDMWQHWNKALYENCGGCH